MLRMNALGQRAATSTRRSLPSRPSTRPLLPGLGRLPPGARPTSLCRDSPDGTSTSTATPPSALVNVEEVQKEDNLQSIFTTSSMDDDDLDEESSECEVFIDRNGEMVPILCCDYGFRSGTGRMYQDADGKLPSNGFQLAIANFQKELDALRRMFRYDEFGSIADKNPATTRLGKIAYGIGGGIRYMLSTLDKTLEDTKVLKKIKPTKEEQIMFDPLTGQVASSCQQVQQLLSTVKLSNQAVWDREHKREASGGGVETPWVVRAIYLSLCIFLDVAYDNRPIQRFWFLETVARMPYFSYITVLHLYESLGWWRAGAELRKVHFAEEWNELHHLQIMESLGGDQLWVDRFMAQHAAIVYYFILVAMYIGAPKLAYNFSELIEAHAVDTYGEFVDANEELLKKLPPPIVAANYYTSSDLYMFDEFQTSKGGAARRPSCRSLYDVFSNIRDDEGEHVKTMKACQDMSVIEELAGRRNRGRRV